MFTISGVKIQNNSRFNTKKVGFFLTFLTLSYCQLPKTLLRLLKSPFPHNGEMGEFEEKI
jgi:hypothetical protein